MNNTHRGLQARISERLAAHHAIVAKLVAGGMRPADANAKAYEEVVGKPVRLFTYRFRAVNGAELPGCTQALTVEHAQANAIACCERTGAEFLGMIEG